MGMSSRCGRFSDDEYRELAAFRQAVRSYLRVSEVNARRLGIPHQEFVALLMIRGHHTSPHVGLTDVAEALQVRHSGVSLLIERMVQKGLVTRVIDDEDRRRIVITLTERGQAMLDAMMSANRAVLRDTEDGLPHLQVEGTQADRTS